MKTKLKLAALIATFFAFQMSAQNKAIINAMNSDISDNLDLTAVTSIFGDSENLNDFERRLNDPKFQVSNLDLNNDNRVDYLRVIESVEKNTHVIIIQSVLGADLYQDVATIEIEKYKHNNISIQIVGNEYIYGQNYIYEPVYVSTPKIYVSFWNTSYRPYYSSWTWDYYPTTYVAWNPYPVYRYRQNVYGCVNNYNTYNYVSYRKCYRAPAIYTSYSCNSYERKHPDYAFSRRNSAYSNRYDMNRKRYSSNNEYRGNVVSDNNNSRNNTNYNNTSRQYYQNRTSTSGRTNYQPIGYKTDNSQNRANSAIVTNRISNQYQNNNEQSRGNSTVGVQRTENQSEYNQNRTNRSADNYNRRDYTQNDTRSQTNNNSQRVDSQRENNQNRNGQSRAESTQSVQSPRDNSQNANNSSRENSTQRSESQGSNENSSRSNFRRI